jgi:hypothetical protein
MMRRLLYFVVGESPMKYLRCRALSAACFVLVMAGTVGLPGVARAQDWRPDQLTILLGNTLNGPDGRITQVLARIWRRHLGSPVVIVSRGPRSLLKAAGEFTHQPRDGSVVLAGDLGCLALAYARERPTWSWARSFEHIGIFARDPALVFIAADRATIDDLDDVVRVARAAPFRVGVRHWFSLENLLLHDIAAQARLNLQSVPIGAGESLLAAVLNDKVSLVFGRQSDIAAKRRAINVLATARAIGPAVKGIQTLDAALATVTAPAGRIGVITVHAGFQRAHPARYERLKRSFQATINDEKYQAALVKLGFTSQGTNNIDHARLITTVRLWWDAYRRVGAKLALSPAPVTTRGKISFVGEGGRVLRYLGLDGKQHNLHANADETDLVIGGVARVGADPLKALRVDMICEITRPSALALEASRLTCN